MRATCLFSILVVLAGSALADSRAKNLELHLSVSGTIEIDPEGRVHDYAIETRLAPVIRDHIDQRVRQWRFEPVTVDGRAVIAKTRMQLNLRAIGTGNDYALHVASVHFGGPKANLGSRRGLRYPPNALRERLGARVMLVLRVDSSGKVIDVHPYQTSLARFMHEAKAARWRRAFEEVAMAGARLWTFEPGEHIGGQAAAATLIAPIEFQIVGMGARSVERDWRAFVPGPVTPAPWQVAAGPDQDRLDGLKDGEAVALSSRFRLLDDVIGTVL